MPWAHFETSAGDFVCELFADRAPATVANFVGLTSGAKEWTDPRANQTVKRPFYDGLVFHRVIPGFMIQGGCPLGNGTGGPGFRFGDEFHPSLQHDTKGVLSMANSGPNTNGSQFFITVVPTPWLDGKHSVFGKVVSGYSVVEKIAASPRDDRDRPKTEVVLRKVTIGDNP